MKAKVILACALLLTLCGPRAVLGVDVDEYMRKGQEAEQGMQWETAIAWYNDITTKEPTYAPAHYRIGVIWEKLGAIEKAVREYQEALRLKPDYVEARVALEGYYVNQGVGFRRAKQSEAALKAFRQALALNPSSLTAHVELGQELENRGQADEATAEYKKAIELEPNNSTAHSHLAAVYASKDQHQEALQEFQEVIRLNPKDPAGHHGAGVAYSELGQKDQAITALQQAIRCYLIAGQRDKALPAWELQKKLRAEKMGVQGGKPAKSAGAPQKQTKAGASTSSRKR